MTLPLSETAKIQVRAVQYRDLEAIEPLVTEAFDEDSHSCSLEMGKQLQQIRRWYGPLKFLSLFPNPYKYAFCVYVALVESQTRGLIQVSPFNRTGSTWKVERVLVDADAQGETPTALEIGSGMLRHCFETIIEARTWLAEIDIHHKSTLALYRQNGFQPLAQLTYWALSPDQLQALAEHEPDLPNLLPISNADAQLLHQLDTVSMPPLVRQVFDRSTQDFKKGFVSNCFASFQQWVSKKSIVSGYVFEPQRKAAIAHFRLQLCRNGSQPHQGQLTVHPAYTWLYPELLSQMARVAQELPSQSLHLASADYQPEREEHLEQLGAERIENTLLMSRSVWHKIREAKHASEGLQLSEMLQKLQPARTPIPSRMSWEPTQSLKSDSPTPAPNPAKDAPAPPELPDSQGNS